MYDSPSEKISPTCLGASVAAQIAVSAHSGVARW